MSRKKWIVSSLDKELASDIAEEYGIDPFAALLLVSRGITDEGEIAEFFSESTSLISPFEIKDMDKAVERISRAMDEGEKIAVYGDYDADGVTSTALMYRFFEMNGCDVITYIPDRNGEGYGLNKEAVRSLKEQGAQLIITVDNGISAFEEAEYIYELGMELVITDHHKAGERIPRAEAVVDPHRQDCPCPYKLWAGVGVAFKVICALSGAEDEEMLSMFSDLVTIGTIGDIVPLTGENRTIVKHGLCRLNSETCMGVAALKKQAGVDGKTLNATSVAFSLVPRINSIGRMAHASKALELLLGEDERKVSSIVETVDKSNNDRQDIEKKITAEAEQQIKSNPDMLCERVLIFSGKNWHGGVIGIVASRLVSKYGKPCIVITDDGKEAKGSGRSIDGFSLYDAISSAKDLLTHYGGHVLAAGFGMKSENLSAFKKAIADYAKTVEMPFPVTELDCRLKPEFISADILSVISALEPFGAGNPQPVFGLYGVTLSSVQPIGSGKHLRLNFRKGSTSFSALYFGVTEKELPYVPGDSLDLAVRLERNEYMGQVRVSIYIKDVRMSGTDDEKYLKSVRLYEKMRRRERLSPKEAAFILPSRQTVAEVFRYIKNIGVWRLDSDVLCYRLGGDGSNACTVLTAIDILSELGILKKEDGAISLKDTSVKVNLEDSRIIKHIKKYL
ncbi:MAG: single-stranded-DNA-specific exonuclease RecJ [Clostridia bacterium]|nr:single-stranded-DNA-specific exonuclease RecJ [Clostridia bacterium]